jgi:YD repeat-containing protein
MNSALSALAECCDRALLELRDYGNYGDSGQGVAWAYDAAGRPKSETTNGKAVSFVYDGASNRTQITWPEGFFVQYVYDALNRLTSVGDSGATTLVSGIAYDPLSRRLSLARGNGTSSGYGYDLDGRLTSLSHSFPAQSASNQAWTFAYNPANQDLSDASTNAAWLWTNRPAGTTSKSYDGLNRDAGLAGIGAPAPCGAGGSFGYDCNGNLTNNGTTKYAYDVENRLTAANVVATGASLETLAYDPLGRLSQTVTPAGGTTTFLYEGDDLVAEYSGATVKHRYAPGPGVDEPLAWYDFSAPTGQVIRWLHPDRQGSIVAQSIAAGTVPSGGIY